MRPIQIDGATRYLGAPMGWKPEANGHVLGLPIRDAVLGGGAPCMVSAWAPTLDELQRLAAGARLELMVVGQVHPPVSISVGEVPPAIPDFPAEAIGAAIRATLEREKAGDPPIVPGDGQSRL